MIFQLEKDFIISQGVPTLVAWPISRNPLHHKGFLQKLQTSSWYPGGLKLTIAKWAYWCEPRNRDPTNGSIENIVNFLAELFHDGYKYWSVSANRSAISALDLRAASVVTRMFRGVYNERPPLPRYLSFWMLEQSLSTYS